MLNKMNNDTNQIRTGVRSESDLVHRYGNILEPPLWIESCSCCDIAVAAFPLAALSSLTARPSRAHAIQISVAERVGPDGPAGRLILSA
jgi:hypothetical protein